MSFEQPKALVFQFAKILLRPVSRLNLNNYDAIWEPTQTIVFLWSVLDFENGLIHFNGGCILIL